MSDDQNIYTIMGIDPGARWTGLAMLRLNLTTGWGRASTAVLDRGLFYPAEWLYTFISSTAINAPKDFVQFHIVCEDFRIRPKKYETFASGETLQLIGALRYVSYYRLPVDFELKSAQAISMDEMKSTPLFSFLQRWRPNWKERRSPAWKHAISAWRVILAHLLTSELKELREQRIFKPSHKMVCAQDNSFRESLGIEHLYVAPSIVWKFKR